MDEKNKKSIYDEAIDIRNPNSQVIYGNVQSLRYVSNEVRTLKEGIYSKIYFGFSMVFAVFISIFTQSFNWVIVLGFVDLLLLILVFFARIFYIQRREHSKISDKIVNQLKKLGLKLE
jgi:hypothetical protein